MDKKRLIKNILIYIFLFIIGILLSGLDELDIPFFSNAISFYLFILSVLLIFYFYFKIIDKPMRKYLLCISVLLSLLVLLRASKYIAFVDTGSIARHLWYLYYLPFLYIPNLIVLASQSLGEDGIIKHIRLKTITLFVTTALFLLVLTNDFHELAFRFQDNFLNWDSDYSYGFVYFVCIAYIAFEIVLTILILIRKCRLSQAKRRIWLPLIPVLYSIIWMVLYATGAFGSINKYFGELPEVFGFSVAGFFLGCIGIGLIPTNKYSKEFFIKSTAAAFVTDNSYQIDDNLNQEFNYKEIDLSFNKTMLIDSNTRLHKNKISGGYVFWFDDIKELNQVNLELKDALDSKMDENELLVLEKSLREERALIDQKSRTYDEITEACKMELAKIKAFAEEAEENLDLYEKNISYISVLVIFIKRCSNLILEGSGKMLSLDDFYVSLNEIMLYLKKASIKISLHRNYQDKSLDSRRIIDCMKAFGLVLTLGIKDILGMVLELREDCLKIMLEGALIEDSTLDITHEDGNSYINIPIGGINDDIL